MKIHLGFVSFQVSADKRHHLHTKNVVWHLPNSLKFWRVKKTEGQKTPRPLLHTHQKGSSLANRQVTSHRAQKKKIPTKSQSALIPAKPDKKMAAWQHHVDGIVNSATSLKKPEFVQSLFDEILTRTFDARESEYLISKLSRDMPNYEFELLNWNSVQRDTSPEVQFKADFLKAQMYLKQHRFQQAKEAMPKEIPFEDTTRKEAETALDTLNLAVFPKAWNEKVNLALSEADSPSRLNNFHQLMNDVLDKPITPAELDQLVSTVQEKTPEISSKLKQWCHEQSKSEDPQTVFKAMYLDIRLALGNKKTAQAQRDLSKLISVADIQAFSDNPDSHEAMQKSIDSLRKSILASRRSSADRLTVQAEKASQYIPATEKQWPSQLDSPSSMKKAAQNKPEQAQSLREKAKTVIESQEYESALILLEKALDEPHKDKDQTYALYCHALTEAANSPEYLHRISADRLYELSDTFSGV